MQSVCWDVLLLDQMLAFFGDFKGLSSSYKNTCSDQDSTPIKTDDSENHELNGPITSEELTRVPTRLKNLGAIESGAVRIYFEETQRKLST